MAFHVCNVEKKDVNFTFTSNSVKTDWVNLYHYFKTNVKAIIKNWDSYKFDTFIRLVHVATCAFS